MTSLIMAWALLLSRDARRFQVQCWFSGCHKCAQYYHLALSQCSSATFRTQTNNSCQMCVTVATISQATREAATLTRNELLCSKNNKHWMRKFRQTARIQRLLSSTVCCFSRNMPWPHHLKKFGEIIDIVEESNQAKIISPTYPLLIARSTVLFIVLLPDKYNLSAVICQTAGLFKTQSWFRLSSSHLL